MRRLICILVFVCVGLFGVSVSGVLAQILFEDNFDSQADWYPTCKVCGRNNTGYTGGGDVVGTPVGWTYWRNDELWNPYLSSGSTSGSHPTIQISSEQQYGATGKAYVQWNESNSGSAGDGWGADGILAKQLDQGVKEIYTQIKIKFKPGFQWYWTPAQNAASLKIFRFYRYDGGGSPFQFFSAGYSAPIYIFDLSNKEAPYGFRAAHSFRCDPQATNYNCSPSYNISSNFTSNVFSDTLGDGNWHTLSWQGKFNSSAGIADGIIRFWVDGLLSYEKTNIIWVGSGGDMTGGWNVVAIGGNAFNSYSDPVNKAEQWYTIDDVVVSTTPIPAGYLIGGPKAPKNLLGTPVKP